MSPTPPQTHLTRGYSIALVSAAILSTTAILIRHLTQTYQLPALILAFWRDLFVVFSLLLALGVLRPDLLKVKRIEVERRYRQLIDALYCEEAT